MLTHHIITFYPDHQVRVRSDAKPITAVLAANMLQADSIDDLKTITPEKLVNLYNHVRQHTLADDMPPIRKMQPDTVERTWEALCWSKPAAQWEAERVGPLIEYKDSPKGRLELDSESDKSNLRREIKTQEKQYARGSSVLPSRPERAPGVEGVPERASPADRVEQQGSGTSRAGGGAAKGRGAKSQAIGALLLRADGCTTADVLALTGWPSVSMPAQAKTCGLALRKDKVDGVTRYWGSK